MTETIATARPTSTASAGSPLVRLGSAALLVGGPLSLVFHTLWRVGHGPTVVNEHGVVLGLTNDQWSYFGGIWMALVAVGVVAVCSLHSGRMSRVAGTLVVTGLAVGAVAAWVWVLYSIGALALYGGILCLAVTVLRGRVLPRTSGAALLLAVLSFVPVVVAPEAVYATLPTALPFPVEGQDFTALCAALGWTALGLGLARARTQRGLTTR